MVPAGRLEHAESAREDRCNRIVADTGLLDTPLVDVFVEQQREVPEEIAPDLEVSDDPLRRPLGSQTEVRFLG